MTHTPRPAFELGDLSAPLIQAPMAGGPSTPALAAAVSRAGGLGFLAGGYLPAAALAEQIALLRGQAGAAPFGVNLFVPRPVAEPESVATYRAALEPEAARLGVALPEPDLDDDDVWPEKISMLLEDPVPVASFTFGLPETELIARLRSQGTYTVATVTDVDEALAAQSAGVDALCVQGPEAGGHRGTFDPAATPGTTALDALLRRIAAVTDLPLIAAGGVGTAKDVARLRAAGAAIVQAGTAFLRTDEAGTQALHRDALADGRFTETVLTRAFSGRWARALRNGFTDRHPRVPAAYPAINQLTKPLRAEAARRGDAQGLSLYAGFGFREAQAGPAADVVARLTAAA
ncbi:nitronate monooxygenase [Actinospica durhamensis]|uniref:Propionate 3-nitronate monooxygenase n=1 Tax=Actinospica durhamensis TaxID=1508375 RepID=A0A941EWH5_9ACTN|nr:nitronate monooxygenase [Actinospica durhamensis]MBR7838546.1 nitronate monooxygenase [Actinospica durhamensis]